MQGFDGLLESSFLSEEHSWDVLVAIH